MPGSRLRVETAFSDWPDRMAAGGPWRVLHSFDSSINLADPSGSVLSLVQPGTPMTPFAVRLDSWPPGLAKIRLDASTQFESGLLQLENWRIDFRLASPWVAKPAWQHYRKILTSEHKKCFMAALDSLEIQPGIEFGLVPMIWNRGEVEGFSRSIAGLGPGLTPSGDDFLMGMVHGAWLLYPAAQARQYAEWLVRPALSRTTTLSGAWLRAAHAGQAGEPWHQLLAALETGQLAAIRQQSAEILSTGHTSGADALAGFRAVFKG